MKTNIKYTMFTILGGLLAVILFGDNMNDIIKVATMQVDTVYCTTLKQVKFDTDTVRVEYKDKLIIVTGRNKINQKFNVAKSEWIDCILLTKPLKTTGCGLKTEIVYEDLIIEHYRITDHIFLTDGNGEGVLLESYFDVAKHTISNETLNNIKVICNRYKY